MDFLELAKKRYSVRAYKPDPVEDDKLQSVLEAARELLGLPDDVEPIAFAPLGYPADQSGHNSRKSLKEMVRHEHW